MLKTALMLLPIFGIFALALWFIVPYKNSPVIISKQKEAADNPNFSGLSEKISSLETKVNSLESSNSALQSQLDKLQSSKAKVSTVNPGKKSPVLIPINPGGTLDAKDWKNLTSGSIKIDPADYPGYKNAYLIINLSVYVGQGKAFARLINPDNGLAILDSEVSTNAYAPVSLTSKPFKLPSGSSNYTIQLKTLVEGGYPAQAGDSFLQITY